MVTSTRRRLALWAVFAVVMGLADAFLLAWRLRSGWGMSMCGAAIAGLIVLAAWSLRPPA